MRKLLSMSCFLQVAAFPAFSCDYCERHVVLSAELAKCYLMKVEAEIEQMEKASLPAQLINLASCDGVETSDRGGGSLPHPTDGTKKLTVSFVLDAPALRCLAVSLQNETWSPEPVKTFEITRDCTAN